MTEMAYGWVLDCRNKDLRNNDRSFPSRVRFLLSRETTERKFGPTNRNVSEGNVGPPTVIVCRCSAMIPFPSLIIASVIAETEIKMSYRQRLISRYKLIYVSIFLAINCCLDKRSS